MGRVFLAEREDGSAEEPSRVALKVLHPHLVERRGYLDRFRREAEMGRAIVHENVVRTYEADLTVADGRPCFYLVLEHVEGRSLRDLLHDLGPLPDALLREIGRQAALGLAAVHAAHVVHRDVKPDNLLVTERSRVCLTDLGVARAEEVSESLTAEGHLPGTALYAAPERVAGLPATAASDLYSLGVVLHELATGENPFRRADAAATLRAQLEYE